MSLNGVSTVEQGFIKSEHPNDAFSEAVIVHYDTSLIRLADLIEVHLNTHASASQHRMREKYRSAIYNFSDEQCHESQLALIHLRQHYEKPLVTQVLPYVAFKASDNKYRNYYYRDKSRPFCRTYIEPKIDKLRQCFPQLIDKK